MFGERIDYRLLRPLAHARNRATEEELDARAEAATFTEAEAAAYLEHVRRDYFRGHLPIRPDLRYLDVGCGIGRLCVSLVRAGARDVVGVDIVPRQIEQARAIAARLGCGDRPQFVCADIATWKAQRPFDVITVLTTMEHVDRPDRFLADLPRLLKPGGVALISHHPFQSPTGDHMHYFFRVQIPWRGLLFSERALLRLRREFLRPTDRAERFQDIVGGLNRMRYGEFLRYTRAAGLKLVAMNINPQFRRHRVWYPAAAASAALTSIPFVRDYFVLHAYGVFRRPGPAGDREP